jgi:hypothetical protein
MRVALITAIKDSKYFWEADTPFGKLCLNSHGKTLAVCYCNWGVCSFGADMVGPDLHMTFYAGIPRTSAHDELISVLLAAFAPRRQLTILSNDKRYIVSDYCTLTRWDDSHQMIVPFDACIPGTPAHTRYRLESRDVLPPLPDLAPLGPNGIPPGPTTLAAIGAFS